MANGRLFCAHEEIKGFRLRRITAIEPMVPKLPKVAGLRNGSACRLNLPPQPFPGQNYPPSLRQNKICS